ncbi:L-idonate 5-dehydrogenase [Falsiroseomonas sp.]|uniref:L-idonate 5-dehydrogenase n=1 Tax=Falsiroseomonas sp. TaxID=2870721 RepID=UPI002735CDAA|nr:L-idonate 5-dehydrogenase [Falsiroseomonas sp.]MDP3414679.1 L-idonate 5-dehydrogenase [Falsiroseomonas sp.]
MQAAKAIIIHAARDLRVEERDSAPPGPGEVAVRIRQGGICGSDLHYYLHGGFGVVRVRQPMVLGHEIAGEVSALGSGVTGLVVGDKVAVNPSRPCGACRYCLAGQAQHCLDMRFYGSAMRMPHVDGGFRQHLVCDAAQAVKLPAGMDLQRAAFAEPLAVCLHAARQAGPLLGARVLITGAGPIGMLCLLVARHAGARQVVMTDLAPKPLALARELGADAAHDLRAEPEALAPYGADKGSFDVVFECAGSGLALAGAIAAARPGATIVQVGIGGDASVPLNTLVAKEITLRGTFRFHEEFALAVDALARGAIDPMKLLTEVVPMEDAVAAFDLAADRTRAMKVQLAL